MQAATAVDATGFALAWAEGMPGNFGMDLLSDTNGTVRIGLDPGLSGHTHDTSLYGNGSDGDLAIHYFTGQVEEGYRITSMTLSAMATGTLYVEPALPCNTCTRIRSGLAENGAGVRLTIEQAGALALLASDDLRNVNGTRELDATGMLSLDDTFWLAAQASDSVKAEGIHEIFYANGRRLDRYYDALSAIDLGNMVLTIQVSAVPEPSAWPLWLAGLGIAGAAAYRRGRPWRRA